MVNSLHDTTFATADISLWNDGAIVLVKIYALNEPLLHFTVENHGTGDSWEILADAILAGLGLNKIGDWEHQEQNPRQLISVNLVAAVHA